MKDVGFDQPLYIQPFESRRVKRCRDRRQSNPLY
jgi:hypothetical protein